MSKWVSYTAKVWKQNNGNKIQDNVINVDDIDTEDTEAVLQPRAPIETQNTAVEIVEKRFCMVTEPIIT